MLVLLLREATIDSITNMILYGFDNNLMSSVSTAKTTLRTKPYIKRYNKWPVFIRTL